MKNRLIVFLAGIMLLLCSAQGQDFDKYFEDATLRVDYVFAGDTGRTDIYLAKMYRQALWAGRRGRLDEAPLAGNGALTMRRHGSKEVIYMSTFSTLYQEWLMDDEAKEVKRAFDCSYNVPMPKEKADITITLYDKWRKVTAEMTHTVDPDDILIEPLTHEGTAFQYVLKGECTTPIVPKAKRSTEKVASGKGRDYTQVEISPFEDVDIAHNVDLAIVAEGYRREDMGKFYADCRRAVDVLFAREPFRSLKNRFNVVAVAAESKHCGVSVPHLRDWRKGTTGTHYDTFRIDRYLMTQEMHRVYDLLAGIPFEHIMVLVNTATYGGGGIYNQVTTSSSDHPNFTEVFVHEFGHSYAGLGDEYAYDDMDTEWYPAGIEPWEPNLTTKKDMKAKWQDMIDEGVPGVGLYEGAGYQSHGCWRPSEDCRMRTNASPDFCPVCDRAIRRITDFYTADR